ncbi:MAG TPA: dihydrolipoyl dehydrogenase [Candidatus Limnocylindrales bacterium]|nr:dihydrolipoyl dehydrogenase [Candidatus Limnocylindrales bacterium]
MPKQRYDLVVIGAGPGGYQAAIRASQLGMKTAVVEKDGPLGGTCLNVGCIPSKALLESSELYAQAREGLAVHGIGVAGVELDLARMMARKTDVVDGLTRGVLGLMKKNKIDVWHGRARIAAAPPAGAASSAAAPGAAAAASGIVEVRGENDGELETPRILIATGSVPIGLPHMPFDGKRILSSTEALALETVPARMLVVGGGAIGLELGSVWARLGSKVRIVELMDQIVPGADRRSAQLLERSLRKQGIEILLESRAVSADVASKAVKVTIEGKDGKQTTESYDVVLVAVGRRAFQEGLGLAEAGVATDERGRITVGAHFETSVPGIFAIGDVVAGAMLAHKASEEGIACVERMAGIAGHVNYQAIPSVVYTWPELASVGLGEEAAKAAGYDVRIGTFPFTATPRARCTGETEGAVRIIADKATDTVLGIHIVGANASELIAEAAVAIEFGATSEDIARSVHAHPTLAEALKEAALGVDGRSIHI